MSEKNIIKIVRDFSKTPGGRYEKEGRFSGEVFRKKYLCPAIKKAIEENKKLLVDLDGTAGCSTGFLETAFGGLIRDENLQYEDIVRVLEIKSDEEDFLINDIFGYLKDANNTKE